MAFIDYLDPNRSGDLNYQRQQRTAALDRELGYDVSGYGGNQQKIQARGQQYGRDLNYMKQSLDAEGLDPLYGLNQQAFMQARNSRNTADSGQHPAGWVNPALNQPSYQSSAPRESSAVQAGATWQPPKLPGADYSMAGKSQEPRSDNLAKYGGFYSGGKWNAYSGPTASVANDRPQQFFDSTSAGRGNYQDYLDTIQRTNAEYQAAQKRERQQRLRGRLIGTSATQGRDGITRLSTFGRAPTEAEMAYA